MIVKLTPRTFQKFCTVAGVMSASSVGCVSLALLDSEVGGIVMGAAVLHVAKDNRKRKPAASETVDFVVRGRLLRFPVAFCEEIADAFSEVAMDPEHSATEPSLLIARRYNTRSAAESCSVRSKIFSSLSAARMPSRNARAHSAT